MGNLQFGSSVVHISFYFWSKIKLRSYTEGESQMFMVLVVSLSLPKCVKWVVASSVSNGEHLH